MNRYLQTILSLAFLLTGPLLAPCFGEHPNIVFIIVDDMGWADLGCYGQQAYATPVLDKMAAEGTRFTQAYSGCTVCAPARCTLMTGLHMGHAPVRGNTGGIPLPDEAVTLPEVLRKAGYTCGGFGKWGLGDIASEGAPERQGFDQFFGYYHQIHAHNYFPEYLVRNSKQEKLAKGDYSHYLIVEETKRFIRANHRQPFFCLAAWTPPHGGYQIPADDPAWKKVKNKNWPRNARVHAAFNLMLDRHVGQLLSLLKEMEIDDKTVVFFCSDHGGAHRFEGSLHSSGPLTGQKRSMHEGGLRVPLIARWPNKIPADRVSDMQTYFPDMMPTLAEFAGASAYVPANVDGISIVPTLFGDDRQSLQERHLYWEWPSFRWGKGGYGSLWQAARLGSWKILRHDQGDPWELYDLPRDVAEQNDIAEQRPDIVNALSAWVDANRTEMAPQIEPTYPGGKKFR